MSLAQNYMRNQKYEEAQNLLDKIPPIGFDKRITQIQLYSEQENYNSAFKELEGMLYQCSNGLISNILQMIYLLCKQKRFDDALKYANRASQVASLFDLGDYAGSSSYFTIYVEMGDKELAMDALERMINRYDTIREPRNSELYQHMKFNEDDDLEQLKSLLLKSFDNDPSLDFIREEPRYQQLYARIVN